MSASQNLHAFFVLIFIHLLPNLLFGQQQLPELFHSGPYPMGNVAVSTNESLPMRCFYSLHPESKAPGARIFEVVDGKSVPFPDSAFQEQFISPLGIYLDNQNRLWILDHGNYALKTPSLYAIDINTKEVLIQHNFSREVVRKWVMLNDLSVSPNGRTVFISAPGMFKKRSSILVFDVTEQRTRRVLTDHPTVMRKKLLPEVDGKKMRFLLGLFKVRPGVDGIDVDPWGKYLYYTPMADTMLYRLPVDAITDPSLGDEELSKLIQRVGKHTMCDGIRVDEKKVVYLTDFQHHRILAMDPDGHSKVLLEDERIRWADGLSVGADGFLYITDSALQHVILKKEKRYKKEAPFGIWRVRIKPE